MDAIHFSSKSDEWATPQKTFDSLDAEFGFVLDAAATYDNAKCDLFFDKERDALLQDWGVGPVWVNPPYSRGLLSRFVAKAHDAAKNGATVVMLIPARTDTRVWHDIIFPFAEIRFLRGRIKFGDAKTGAPFPSAVVIFRPQETQTP